MKRTHWSPAKRIAFVMAAIVYTTAMGCTVVHSVELQQRAERFAQPCETDTECMERFGGDGGPGQ